MSEHLVSAYPVVVRIPVQWGELDAYGHVNNTVFFRYFESARVAYLERCGFTESYQTRKVGAILHSTSCRFRKPLFYPDEVLVGTRASSVEADRFTMEYLAVSRGQGAVAAEGSGIVVSFDYVGRRVAPIPESVRGRIAEIEAAQRGAAGAE